MRVCANYATETAQTILSYFVNISAYCSKSPPFHKAFTMLLYLKQNKQHDTSVQLYVWFECLTSVGQLFCSFFPYA